MIVLFILIIPFVFSKKKVKTYKYNYIRYYSSEDITQEFTYSL